MDDLLIAANRLISSWDADLATGGDVPSLNTAAAVADLRVTVASLTPAPADCPRAVRNFGGVLSADGKRELVERLAAEPRGEVRDTTIPTEDFRDWLKGVRRSGDRLDLVFRTAAGLLIASAARSGGWSDPVNVTQCVASAKALHRAVFGTDAVRGGLDGRG